MTTEVLGTGVGAGGLTRETEGWAHPVHAPLYFPRLGQQTLWHKNVGVVFHADPQVLQRFVPAPLELVGDEVFVGATDHYQPGHGLPVKAAGLSVAVRYGDLEGTYNFFTLANADETVCANREELGMPVVLGEIRLWAEGNTWWGTGTRDGAELIRVSVFPQRMLSQDEAKGRVQKALILYKHIPSADPERRPWRQVLAIHLDRSGPVQEYSVGRGAVVLAPSRWGLHNIEPRGVIRGVYNHFGVSLKSKIECLWEDRPGPIP